MKNYLITLYKEFTDRTTEASTKLNIISNLLSIAGISFVVIFSKLAFDDISSNQITVYTFFQGLFVTCGWLLILFIILAIINLGWGIIVGIVESIWNKVPIILKIIYVLSISFICLFAFALYLNYGIKSFVKIITLEAIGL